MKLAQLLALSAAVCTVAIEDPHNCAKRSSCGSCAAVSGAGPCAWCVQTLTCGPWDSTKPSGGWQCVNHRKPNAKAFVGHEDHCGWHGGAGGSTNGPLLVGAEITAENGFPPSGEFTIDLTLRHIGEDASPWPRKQNITVGPFPCLDYRPLDINCKNCSAIDTNIGYGCNKVHGIGANNKLDLNVYGSAELEISPGIDGWNGYFPSISFDPPTIASFDVYPADPATSALAPVKSCSSEAACQGFPGDRVVLHASGLPFDSDTVTLWEETHRAPAVSVHIGKYVCQGLTFDQAELRCVVPDGVGVNLPVIVTVGGQPHTGSTRIFSYQVTPSPSPGQDCDIALSSSEGPSYGWLDGMPLMTISSTCRVFGSQRDHGQVMVYMKATGINDTAVFVPKFQIYNSTMVRIQPGPSGQIASRQFVVYVVAAGQIVGQGELAGPHNVFTYQACGCNSTSPGSTCRPDGMCVCGGNWNFRGDRGCQCDYPGRFNPCYYGKWDREASCGCVCREQWVPTPTPATDVPPVAVCDFCGGGCGGLLDVTYPTQNGQECLCHFNQLHLIWMIGGSIALLACCVLLFLKLTETKEDCKVVRTSSVGMVYSPTTAGCENEGTVPLVCNEGGTVSNEGTPPHVGAPKDGNSAVPASVLRNSNTAGQTQGADYLSYL